MYWLSGVLKTFRNHQKSNPGKILHRNYVSVFYSSTFFDEKKNKLEKKGGKKREKTIENRKFQLKSNLKSIFQKSVLNYFSIGILDFFPVFIFYFLLGIVLYTKNKYFWMIFFFLSSSPDPGE